MQKKTILFLFLFLFLSKPALSQNSDLQEWVHNAASEVMTFGFNDLDERMEENKKFFTQEGFESYSTALNRAEIPETVINNKYVVTGEPLCMPEILEKTKIIKGDYYLEFPFKVVWLDGQRQKTDYLRVQTVVNSIGDSYGIRQWIATPSNEDEASSCSRMDLKRSQIKKLQKEIFEKEKQIEKLRSELKEN